ncbi:MAG: DsbA family protein [Gammaproteobacteria bacterium]|nr:DsbA family protein [Gammaproteobacteria bacterium]
METQRHMGRALTFSKKIRLRILNLYLGENFVTMQRRFAELKRKLSGQPHTVSVFLQLDDPYSYLLSHYLQFFAKQYEVVVKIYLAQTLGKEYTPQPGMLAEYAVRDCTLMARELGVPFLDKGPTPVVEFRRALIDALASEHDSDNFPDIIRAALAAYWRGDTEGVKRFIRHDEGSADELIAKNQRLLAALGHYNCAMLHYAGEWYWGVDRLHYLTRRLDDLGLNRTGKANPALASIRQAMQLNLPAAVPDKARALPPLELFYSFRSPYAYLSLRSAFRIASAFGLKINVRPVLPMVMRGLPVPKTKLLYIVRDAKREAARLGVPFEKFVDSVGAGAERCIATFFYAVGEGKAREFVLEAGNAIWNEATDVASDEGLRMVTERVGLFWPEVKAALGNDDWRKQCEVSREVMTELGVWGVPVFRIGDIALWGQDRDWLIARQIEDLCHGGEGFMV